MSWCVKIQYLATTTPPNTQLFRRNWAETSYNSRWTWYWMQEEAIPHGWKARSCATASSPQRRRQRSWKRATSCERVFWTHSHTRHQYRYSNVNISGSSKSSNTGVASSAGDTGTIIPPLHDTNTRSFFLMRRCQYHRDEAIMHHRIHVWKCM